MDLWSIIKFKGNRVLLFELEKKGGILLEIVTF